MAGPTGMQCADVAIKTTQRIGHVGRCGIRAPVPIHLKLVARAARKMQRELALSVSQDVDRKRSAWAEGFER